MEHAILRHLRGKIAFKRHMALKSMAFKRHVCGSMSGDA